jgi:TPR repeat protein
MYERGRGVAKDRARAAALYKQACDGGDAKGCTNLKRLGR